MDPVHFVGGDRKVEVPVLGGDVWSCNRIWRDRPWLLDGCSHWFELHPMSFYRDDSAHIETLGWLGPRAVMADPLPGATPFPRDELLARYGPFMWNTHSWVLAFALWSGVRELHLWASDPMTVSKREEGLGTAWWAGRLVGAGMRVVAHGGWLGSEQTYG